MGPGPQWGPFRTDRAGRRDARFARAHQTVSARARRGLHFCQVAARGRAGRFAPWGPGPQWGPGPTEPTGETLASLVLIKPLAHVRGPVPGFSIRGTWPRGTIRANGRRLNAAPVQAVRTRPRRRRVQVSSRIFEEESWRVTGRSAARLRGAVSKLPTYLWPLFRLCAVRFLRTDRALVCGLDPV